MGGLGLIGLILRFVGPLTIAPTISLIGLSLTHVVSDFCDKQWGIALLGVVDIVFKCHEQGASSSPVLLLEKEVSHDHASDLPAISSGPDNCHRVAFLLCFD